jgi:hypothetical protein
MVPVIAEYSPHWGDQMGALGRSLPHLFFVLLLAGCAGAVSETRSLVSKNDLSASKYHRVAVFIENLGDSERAAAEQIVVSTLQNVGVNAANGPDVLDGRGALTENEKASIVQREFDAVLYMAVLEKGVVEELVPGASHNNGYVVFHRDIVPGFGASFATDIGTDGYILKPDGSVYKPILALKIKVDLQDTKTAKEVWTSETIASGDAKDSSMNDMFGRATQQITEKMRVDGAI